MSVSIIVPIFNASKYLTRCIDSVLKQTISEYELILVDDGSTDDSLHICKKYAEADCRIKVLRQDNKGAGAARNTGMSFATKEYIGFIDADDWIEPQMYEKLYIRVKKENADIGICSMYMVDSEGKRTRRYNKDAVPGEFDNHELARYVFERENHRAITAWVWNKLFRSGFLKDNGINYDESLWAGEDVRFMTEIMSNPLKTVFLDEPLYNHTQGAESLSRKYRHRTYDDRLRAYLDSICALEKKGFEKGTIDRMKVFYCYHALNYAEKALFYNDDKGINEAIQCIKRFKTEYCEINSSRPERIERLNKLLNGEIA